MPEQHSTTQTGDVPLWKGLVLSLAHKERDIHDFSTEELNAIFNKAVTVRKPAPGELDALRQDAKAREDYILRFTRFYKAGMPPWSGISESITEE